MTKEFDGLWVVYGLISPRSGWLFYVGVTSRLHQRLLHHYSCPDGNATRETILELRAEGLRFTHCVFGVFGDKFDALKVERQLIKASPYLVNRMHNEDARLKAEKEAGK